MLCMAPVLHFGSVPCHLSTVEKNAILTQQDTRLRHSALLLFKVMVLHVFVLHCKVCLDLSSMRWSHHVYVQPVLQ